MINLIVYFRNPAFMNPKVSVIIQRNRPSLQTDYCVKQQESSLNIKRTMRMKTKDML